MTSKLTVERTPANCTSVLAGGYGFLSCAAAEASQSAPAAVVGPAEILTTGLSLVLVVAAIVAVAWLFGRLQGGRVRNAGMIDVVAAQPLGAKERLLLVDVGGRHLLLGVTQSTIRTLHVLDQPVAATPDAPRQGGFGERFRELLQGSSS